MLVSANFLVTPIELKDLKPDSIFHPLTHQDMICGLRNNDMTLMTNFGRCFYICSLAATGVAILRAKLSKFYVSCL